ncbi:MAG: 3-methyl-2-oxobutanoate hydroxymethyltransferase [Fibrobacter sp.]|jgi:3-methyl-2-oxobutanoate hydroxymethyltransferase|nr:3-methyl-2-oxobutanoate hydroxymethyltransferase [Fibrobacter sp.]
MLSIRDLKEKKKNGEPVSMITAYDFAFAQMAERAGIDQILVGDSLANTMLGYSSTREIGMNEMKIFTSAVRRGAPDTHIVADMPYLSDENPKAALQNAKALLECGADSVKIEGVNTEVLKVLRDNEIEIVGHIGLQPQTAKNFKQHGKTPEEAERIFKEAEILNALGVFEIVLEHIPEELGKRITQEIPAITIGIGAGRFTDGQVLVLHDVLGLHDKKNPPFAARLTNLFDLGVEGISKYIEHIRQGS